MNSVGELLQSAEEHERKEGILIFSTDPSPENIALLAQLAERDDSIELRFVARKALHRCKHAQGNDDGPAKSRKIDPQKIAPDVGARCLLSEAIRLFKLDRSNDDIAAELTAAADNLDDDSPLVFIRP